MSNSLPFDNLAHCDSCRVQGSFDLYGDYYCINCLAKVNDVVNHPSHYTAHPSRVECIQITEHMGFNLGNAIKYIWRADLKNDAIEDLKKARWYVDREISRRETI